MPNVYEMLGIPEPKEAAPSPSPPTSTPSEGDLKIYAPAPQPSAPTLAAPPPSMSPSVSDAAGAPEGTAPRGLDLIRQAVTDIGNVPKEDYFQAARDAAANIVRYGSGAIQIPSAVTLPTGVGPAIYGGIGAGSEALAQYIQKGELYDKPSIALAGAIPPAISGGTRLAQRAAPAIARNLPGAAASLGSWAVEKARGILPPMVPATKASILYKQIAAGPNPRIRADNMLKAAHEALLGQLQLQPELQGPLKSKAEALIRLYQDHGGQVPFKELWAHMVEFRDISKMVKRAQGGAGTRQQAAYGALASGIADDLLDAGLKGTAGKASSALRVANETYRKQKAIQQLTKSIESGIEKGRSDALTTINPAKPLNLLDENQFLRESFSPTEVADIRTVLGELRGMPTLPPPSGEAAKFGRQAGQAVAGGLLGGVAGQQRGNPEIGIVAGATAPMVIAAAVSTPGGRSLLLRMLRANQGVIDERGLRVLGQFARGAAGSLLTEE